MEKNTKEKGSLLTLFIVAVISFALGAGAMYLEMRGAKSNNGDVVGTWYSTYADRTFKITLNKDKTFEYGYEGQDMTTGKYTSTNEVISLTTDQGTSKLIYAKGKGFIELSDEKYYDSKDEAAKNDAYYFVPADYDTSMFTKITVAEFVEKFNKGEAAFVLTARGSCGYCQQFRPVAAESVKKYNYTLYYLDTTTVKAEDFETIQALDTKFSDFGSTPNVYYFKNKAVVDVQQGAADATTFGAFLTKNGVKEK